MRATVLRFASSLLLVGLAVACSAAEPVDADAPDDDGEPASADALTDAPTLPDETDSSSPITMAPLDGALDLVDVRGVGDSGWSTTHVSPALPAEFGAALDRFDAAGRSYRGDLSFLNWESVVADGCDTFAKANVPGQSYAFISRADNLRQAKAHGFGLIGFSNNHTRDCARTSDGLDGTASTLRAARAQSDVLFHGVAEDAAKRTPAIGSFSVKGRTVRVAFASVFVGRGTCPGSPCADDEEKLMAAMKSADVDLRILALHSVDDRNQEELVRVGARFVEAYGGDVVYGSGPHVWRPVRVLHKPDGRRGVVFESVGNFLHPGLAAQAKNYVGRALFDKSTLELRQVQLVAIGNSGRDLSASREDPSTVPANLRWKRATDGKFNVAWTNVAR